MIRITNLSKIYKSKRRKKSCALNNISLTLPDTGLVFVLGKSGSGKSTFLNLVSGLDSITSGEIEVDGNNLASFNEQDFCNYRNTHIGFIFQDYHLIDELTVYDNICLSLNLRRIEDRGLVSNALKKVDLGGYEDRYPGELSGGERQRIGVARALIKNPKLLILDEATASLDSFSESEIMNTVNYELKNITTILLSLKMESEQ